MAKLKVEFDGFDAAVKRLTQLEGSAKKATEEALVKSKRHVHQNLGAAMQPHNKTMETVRALKSDSTVQWVGSVASIGVGFDIAHGGLPSIFLMYGTPRMDKDQKLYNAVYGTKTKKEVKKIQEEIFREAIRKAGG